MRCLGVLAFGPSGSMHQRCVQITVNNRVLQSRWALIRDCLVVAMTALQCGDAGSQKERCHMTADRSVGMLPSVCLWKSRSSRKRAVHTFIELYSIIRDARHNGVLYSSPRLCGANVGPCTMRMAIIISSGVHHETVWVHSWLQLCSCCSYNHLFCSAMAFCCNRGHVTSSLYKRQKQNEPDDHAYHIVSKYRGRCCWGS